jgi:hypothetical protein
MSVIYYVYLEDDDVGEVEGFYKEDKLLATWCLNDANWRAEYMNPLLERLGFEVELPPEDSNLYDKLKEVWTNE